MAARDIPAVTAPALDAALVARAREAASPCTSRAADMNYDIVVTVEEVAAGTPIDTLLRREQTIALLELLGARR